MTPLDDDDIRGERTESSAFGPLPPSGALSAFHVRPQAVQPERAQPRQSVRPFEAEVSRAERVEEIVENNRSAMDDGAAEARTARPHSPRGAGGADVNGRRVSARRQQ